MAGDTRRGREFMNLVIQLTPKSHNGHGHVADGGDAVKIGALISPLRRPVATSAHAFPKTPSAPPGSRAEGRSR